MSDRSASNQSWMPLAFAAAAAAVGLGALATLSWQSNVQTITPSNQQPSNRLRSRAEPFSARHLTGPFTASTDQTIAPTSTQFSQTSHQSSSQFNVADFFNHLQSYTGSASGKVLLTGGYLILDAKYSGWVISMSARFHSYLTILNSQSSGRAFELLEAYNSSCRPQWKLPSSLETYRQHCYGYNQSNQLHSPSNDDLNCVFIIYSPQRSTRLSEYWISLTPPTDPQYPCPTNSITSISQSIGQSNNQSSQMERNPFVETCLYTVIHLLSSICSFEHLQSKLAYPIFVHLEADQAFYSAQPIDQSNNQPINPNLKTGLGSSAALVSSLTGALFESLGMNDQSINRSITWLPLPSQLVNDPSIHQSQIQTTMNESFAFINDDLTSGRDHPADVSDQSSNQSFDDSIEQSFVPLTLTRSNIRELCHSTAQLAHCVAQGKVGSGFDVAAAFYGSSLYQRFDPAIIDSITQSISSHSVGRPELVKCLLPAISHEQHESRTHIDPSIRHSINHSISSLDSDHSVDSSDSDSSNLSINQPVDCSLCHFLRDRLVWNHVNHSIKLPRSIKLSLADVQGGASTPTMVKQVLKWQAEHREESDQLFDSINQMNNRIVSVVKEMCTIEEHDDGELNELINQLADLPSSQWRSLSSNNQSNNQSINLLINQYLTHMLSLVEYFAQVRSLYRQLGAASGAAIVPDSQLSLCELLASQPGVVAAGLPGAGGEDALFVLSINRSNNQSNNQLSWSRALPSHVLVLPVSQLDRPMTTETRVGHFSAQRVFL